MLTVLDLFSGIGGFSLGLERTGGFKTIGFVEIDPYCRAVLKKHWPEARLHPDIKTFQGSPTDVVTGGFPCQPFSKAGKRLGQADDRALWAEMFRIVRLHSPTWVIGENVDGIVSMGLDEVLSDLDRAGYSCRAFVIPACAVGADHQRNRVWIVAHADRSRSQERFLHSGASSEARCDVYGKDSALDSWRTSEPPLVRAFHGIPRRVDRIRALGNAIVPQIAEMIGHAILNAEKEPQ